MESFKVSVVIPVYKTEKWLSKCIDSVLCQTYKNLEIILVDDGSPDNGPIICDEYAKTDGRITVIHKENGGLSSARNVGIEKSTGHYVLFLDSDDYLVDYAIKEMVDIAISENSSAVYPNKYYKVFEKTEKVDLALHFPEEYFNSDPKQFALDVLIGKSRARRSTAVLYSLAIIKSNAEKCKYPLGKISEDFFFNLRFLSCAKKISLYSKPTLYNLKRNGSISTSYYSDFFDTILLMDDEVVDFFATLGDNYETNGRREGLFFRNAFIFALNVLGDKNTPKKVRKQKCIEIFEHERFQNAINSNMVFPYFEGKLKRAFFKIALWSIKKKMYHLTFSLSFIALKFNAV